MLHVKCIQKKLQTHQMSFYFEKGEWIKHWLFFRLWISTLLVSKIIMNVFEQKFRWNLNQLTSYLEKIYLKIFINARYRIWSILNFFPKWNDWKINRLMFHFVCILSSIIFTFFQTVIIFDLSTNCPNICLSPTHFKSCSSYGRYKVLPYGQYWFTI